jgi:hypothetical protein
MAENFAESGDFHVTFVFFYMPYSTKWHRRLYLPSEGRRATDFFARKIRRLRPGLNQRIWVPKDSTLPVDHRSRFKLVKLPLNKLEINKKVLVCKIVGEIA